MSPETTPTTGAAPHADEPSIPTNRLRRKDLVGIAELSADEISLILDTAVGMKEISSRPMP